LERRDEVEERPSPSIEPPNNNGIDLAPPSGAEQLLSLGPSLGTGADLLLLEGDLPAAALRVLAHGGELHREGLLVMG